jgi:hypothetical protein
MLREILNSIRRIKAAMFHRIHVALLRAAGLPEPQ